MFRGFSFNGGKFELWTFNGNLRKKKIKMETKNKNSATKDWNKNKLCFFHVRVLNLGLRVSSALLSATVPIE